MKRNTQKVGKYLALFLLLSSAWAGAPEVSAQSLPLEDKAKYEKALEMKVNEVLLRVLGPNQANVLVQAVMDFSRTEKVEINSGSASKGKDALFRWQNISGESSQSGPQLLPGFPVASSLNPGGNETQSYQREMLFPPNFLKKLSVTIVINKEIGAAEAENIKNVVSDLLAIDVKRGDDLVLVRAPFAPVWKTIWYTPESLALAVKYGLMTLMGIVGMVVVAIGFLKLAGAMNTMAKAQQSHQVNMDLGKDGGPGGPGGEASALAMDGKLALAGPKNGEPEPGPEGQAEVMFNVRPDQVPFLVNMLGKENPANIALITGHLPPEVRNEFLRSIPIEVSSEVIANMARVRFVEPDVIATLKDELERRLSGAVGGVGKVLEVLEQVSLKAKKGMLDKLAEKHPEIAREVRACVLLAEDLVRLSEKDISILVSVVKVEDWSSAAWELPQELKDKVRGQMAEKTWQMVEQTMKYGSPSAEKIEKAIEDIVAASAKLIKEGKIADPLDSLHSLLTVDPAVPLSGGQEVLAGSAETPA